MKQLNTVLLFIIAMLLCVAVLTPSHASGDGWFFPAGGIIAITAGSCPPGFTEQNLVGRELVATINANGDVGATGGSNSYTPAGTNGTVNFTPQGTNGTVNFTPQGTNNTPTVAWPVGVPTISGIAASFSGNAVTAASTTNGTKLVTSNTSTGVSPVTTAAGTVTVTNQGAVAWPAGVPTLSGAPAFTGTQGTVPAQAFTGTQGAVPAETFTGSAATITPPYVKAIFCKKD